MYMSDFNDTSFILSFIGPSGFVFGSAWEGLSHTWGMVIRIVRALPSFPKHNAGYAV